MNASRELRSVADTNVLLQILLHLQVILYLLVGHPFSILNIEKTEKNSK